MTKAAFVLASVMGHSMIVNRFDYDPESGVGVCAGLLNGEIPALPYLICKLASACRAAYGDGVVVIDGGANIGSFTVPIARHMTGWGRVIAFEPQRWPYYALCGNLAINNCFNVEALNQALGSADCEIVVPLYDQTKLRNVGGLSLGGQFTGIAGVLAMDHVWCEAIDMLGLPRLDILKLDIEGMEPQALRGAKATIAEYKPIIIAEGFICGPEDIVAALPDYECLGLGPDLLCIHKDERNAELRQAMRDLAKQLGLA